MEPRRLNELNYEKSINKCVITVLHKKFDEKGNETGEYDFRAYATIFNGKYGTRYIFTSSPLAAITFEDTSEALAFYKEHQDEYENYLLKYDEYDFDTLDIYELDFVSALNIPKFLNIEKHCYIPDLYREDDE